jgi:Metallo-beta-lactamase superfamily
VPPSSKLQYRVLVSGLLPVSGLPLPDGTRPRWSPLSHTLMFGPAEAVVVDPPITVAQATALANWIESFGMRLTYIYVTHWHADHWLAASELAKRFPGVTAYASGATIGRMVKSTPDGVPGGLWAEWFPGQLPQTPIPILAQPVPAGGFTVDGHPVVAVEAGHSDTDDTTVLHAPSIGLVAAATLSTTTSTSTSPKSLAAALRPGTGRGPGLEGESCGCGTRVGELLAPPVVQLAVVGDVGDNALDKDDVGWGVAGRSGDGGHVVPSQVDFLQKAAPA